MYIGANILFMMLMVKHSIQNNLHVLSSQNQQTSFIQQANVISMSSLSLIGSVSSNMPPYLELSSIPDGIAKIMIGHNDVQNGALHILFNEQVVLSMNQQHIYTQAQEVKVQNLRFSGQLFYAQQPQWKLIVNEQFWLPATGWTDSSITTCGGIHMLGGYGKFAGGEVQKQFQNISTHQHLKIVGNYHFIDAWSGESGFMRANIGRDGGMEYLWTEKYDYSKSKNGINVCGANYPEGKLSQKIEITIPHTSDSITIGFGSTLDQDAEENSFGISNFQIYII